MRHFPVFLDLHARRVLILGTGEVAHRKAAAVTTAGAEVLLRPHFSPADLAGCALAIGADAPQPDLEALFHAAHAAGIPVNTVDQPALCSYITPAIIDRDPITIAIGTGGAAPVLARLLRARIEAIIPPVFGRLAALAATLSRDLRARFTDLRARRRVLERILTGPAADLVFAHRDAEAETVARAEMADAIRPTGTVHLVGAGPGAADLLTLRALRLLGEADVIVHDRLVSAEVLDLARRDARRIYVGKARANHCVPQPEINALLIRLARGGNKVIRLKGGDPTIFGRAGEEAAALAAAGIACEIVPGITAALACAADLGASLTHRDHARTVTLATGHTADGKVDLDFAALVALRGTVAIYMGLKTLPAVRDGFRTHGLPRTTPAALVENGSMPQRRILRGTLDSLAADAPGWSTGGPTLLIIGEALEPGLPSRESLRIEREPAYG